MAKIKIVCDSSAGLADEEIKKYNITIIPLSVMVDGTVYVERETITNDQFPAMMKNAKSLPKTSQPPIGKFVDAFDKLGEDGSEVLCVTMMESISGTVHAAEQAAGMTKTKVTVYDSQTTDQGMAFQIVEAAKVIEDGGSVDDAIEKMKSVLSKSKLYLAIDNLDNLVAGGRISKFAGAVSNLLNIKVMLQVYNGQIHIESKGRGLKSIHKEWGKILDEMAQGPKVKKIGISHVDAGKEVDRLLANLKELYPNIDVTVRETVPIIATHTGMGACCLLYYTE
ncbi:DegV family protein [Limosilactobacillus sp. STM2_1]|uniref:DegV family protein n=1 Tax=Limosilactobacillus rudii TaxID=2759755 RepID=A0A7W3UK29_9LACO|nr:DegV family protein [Limosilactobacillus rudii]MBB1079098.1 DegV family protein [Limosilactobacillus rudii]MBB1097027.1 DegV family protein [Limosilactobacillus rudii]MCD7133995.1 DegV family protein [Limosilactobacillus rudii]